LPHLDFAIRVAVILRGEPSSKIARPAGGRRPPKASTTADHIDHHDGAPTTVPGFLGQEPDMEFHVVSILSSAISET